jgi:hypothetical protein
MRLIDNLRNAERKSLANVRRHMDRAKEEWTDVERRIRQRMRVYPQKLRNKINAGMEPGTDAATTDSRVAAAAAHSSKPIISINGEDVPEQEVQRKIG